MRISTLTILALVVVLFGSSEAQEQPQPSSTLNATQPSASPSSNVTSSAPAFTTITSTLTTTLTGGQTLPTSLTVSASHNGSVWYLPVTTTAPVPTATPTATNATATATVTATTATATPSSSSTVLTSLPLKTVIDPAFGVLGAILILTGLPMGFYGHRNRWSSYFLSGFFALALTCICIILRVGVIPAINPPSKGIRGLFLVASVVAGLIGGILSIVFWRGAGLLASGLGGFMFGLFLQAVRPGGLIQPIGLRYVLYIGLYAVFFSASCIERIHSLVLALATAIVGASALTLGIDCFTTQGLKEFYIRNLGFDALFSSKYPPIFSNGHFPLVQGMQIELGVLGALILMGLAFQIRLWSDLRAQLTVLKRSDERRNMRSKAERAARAIARSAKRDLEAWEARHGYKKTASGSAVRQDEESMPTMDDDGDAAKASHSRNSSFMTIFRSNTNNTQLATPTSFNEKMAESPAASSVLGGSAFPFPPQSTGRGSSQFLDYIRKGPEKVEVEGPLKLELPGTLLPFSESGKKNAAGVFASPLSDPGFTVFGTQTPGPTLESSRNELAGRTQSLDLFRAPESQSSSSMRESFRTRSASTAALMDNNATFLNLPENESAGSKTGRSHESSGVSPPPARSASSVGETRPGGSVGRSPLAQPPATAASIFNAGVSNHERSMSTPTAYQPTMTPRSEMVMESHFDQTRMQSTHHSLDFRRSEQPSHSFHQPPVAQGTNAAEPMTTVTGTNPAVLAARRSLASRRDERPAVPWTNPGADAGQVKQEKRKSAESSSHVRAMSIEALEARHRAKLAAMQRPATETVQEAEALRRAKEEWERKQKAERRRMMEREQQKMAATAAAQMAGSQSASRQSSDSQRGAVVSTSREDRRRPRALSATLLEAVGEESRDMSGVDRAAEWRNSLSKMGQMDSSAVKAAAASQTAAKQVAAATRGPNPFPVQPSATTKRLSDTDRRRLNQGAADRSSRRYSQPLLDFKLPGAGQQQ